nr:hypothetical protein BaRGS_024513 [Batillaria attramentaria]
METFTVCQLTLLLLLLAVVCVVHVSPQSSSWPCPAPCACREDHLQQVGRAYTVLCSHQRLPGVPDLAPLVVVDVAIMLKLDYCDLVNVTRADFPAGLQLAVLHLNGNAALRVSSDAFQNVRGTLVLLDLQAVNLPFNDTLRFLAGCDRLQELSLSFNNKGLNHAPHVTAGLFTGLGLTSLRKLKLYNCNIRSLAEDVFLGAESLQDLILGSNELGSVPVALGRLHNLVSLDLSSNAISHVDNDSFSSLTRLEELLLRRNSINVLESGAFNGLQSSLKTLVMENCSLREVPTQALRPLANLTSLDLTGNLFTDVGPDVFLGQYCLSELYISSRTMSFDKLMFTGQRFCIRDLKIRRAELTSVPLDPIKDLTKLHYLFLDKNNITRLRKDGLKGIVATTISFSDNPIRTIEKGAFNGLRPKVSLLLERTEVSDLGFLFDYPNDTISFLSLYESPIPCDCTLKRIRSEKIQSSLYGTCSHRGTTVNLKDPKLDAILEEKCRAPETVIVKRSSTAVPTSPRTYTVEPAVRRRDNNRDMRAEKKVIKKKKKKTNRAALSVHSSAHSPVLLVLVSFILLRTVH